MELLLLGFLQGVLEWLPVSSEGIVAVVSSFLGYANPVDLALYLHMGTMLAVLAYFREDFQALPKNKELLRFLAIATAVSLAVAFPLYLALKTIMFSGGLLLGLVGVGLIATGVLLGRKTKAFRSELTDKDALAAGFLQGLAVVPGFSRSGATMFALLATNHSVRGALRTSFMMSVPVVLAANIFIALQGFSIQPEYFVAMLTAFVFGLATMHALLRLARSINFSYFCFFFGLLSLAAVFFF